MFVNILFQATCRSLADVAIMKKHSLMSQMSQTGTPAHCLVGRVPGVLKPGHPNSSHCWQYAKLGVHSRFGIIGIWPWVAEQVGLRD